MLPALVCAEGGRRVKAKTLTGRALPATTTRDDNDTAIRDLDLADNLLGAWADVLAIARQLPRLAELVLSRNRIEGPTPSPEDVRAALPACRELYLNETRLDWPQVR